jgi:HAD superfamily hydrolase (TIGR01549 family)
MVSVISFDLDGTIMLPSFADSVWLVGLPTIYAKQKHTSFEHAQTFLKERYDAISSDRREWYDLSYWIDALDLSINVTELLNMYRTEIKPFSDVQTVIPSFSKSYSLIICSGAMKEFIKIQLSSSNLAQYFSHIFSSTSDTNMVKKDPSFYLYVAKKLSVKQHDIVHVGDNETYDYLAPKKAGFHAFHLCRDTTCSDTHTIRNLTELADRLKTLPA